MSIGRLLRTARHLSFEQFLFSAVRRLRHEFWCRAPQARQRIADEALALPDSDPARPALAPIADSVAALQAALHPDTLDALRTGTLSFLGEAVHIDSWAHFPWRAERGEGNSPLRRLTLAYFGWAVPLLATGKAEDLERVDEAIRSLEAEPWAQRDIFRDLWNPYTASHRLINLVTGLHRHARAGGSLTSPAALRLHEHFRFCAGFVAADPERDLQANHLLKNWTALAVFAATTTDPAGVFRFLPAVIRRSLDQLVLPDGGHAERSPMYHALGIADIDLIQASGALPAQPWLEKAAHCQRRALSLLTHPDGDIALFNDAWLGGAPRPHALRTELPPPGATALPDTGYVRLGTTGEAVIFDCGPCGLDLQPGHAHADFLSFEFSLAATRFIVDPGTPTYTAGRLRDLSRSAAAHNGPHVEGIEPIEFWKSFRVGRRATAGGLFEGTLARAPLWCAGWHDGYRSHGVEPRRWIGLWPGRGLLVIDLWTGTVKDRVKTLFLIPDEWTAVAVGGTLAFNGPTRVEIEALAGHLEIGRAVWWPRYGSESPATTLRAHPTSAGLSPMAAVLFTWGERVTIDPAMLTALVHGLANACKVAPSGYQV